MKAPEWLRALPRNHQLYLRTAAEIAGVSVDRFYEIFPLWIGSAPCPAPVPMPARGGGAAVLAGDLKDWIESNPAELEPDESESLPLKPAAKPIEKRTRNHVEL